MDDHGFLRVASAVPVQRVGDCAFNAEAILRRLHEGWGVRRVYGLPK